MPFYANNNVGCFSNDDDECGERRSGDIERWRLTTLPSPEFEFYWTAFDRVAATNTVVKNNKRINR